MQTNMWKKGLVFGILLILFGSIQAVSINMQCVRAADTTPLIPMTTTWYGNKDLGTRTVLLTEEQATEVEQLIKNIQEYIKSGVTNNDAALRFNHAIETLDTYGLLPKGMTVERGQHVFQEMVRLQNENTFGETVYHKILSPEYQTNYLCFIVGNISNDIILGPAGRIGMFLFTVSVVLKMPTLMMIGFLPMIFSLFIHAFSPIGFMQLVSFPSGNLYTLGLKGVKYFNLSHLLGIIHGFNGISLNGGLLKSHYLLGVALAISG